MPAETVNEKIANQCCKGGGAGGHVDEAIDIVDRSIGKYKCPIGSRGSMPRNAQAPTTVSPLGNLRG